MINKWISFNKLSIDIGISLQTLKLYLSRSEFAKYTKFDRKYGHKFLKTNISLSRLEGLLKKRKPTTAFKLSEMRYELEQMLIKDLVLNKNEYEKYIGG
ncbi:MAG: hypothetical protein MJ211_10195 [Bacteroidales bacterium]|nr:hypothetical protein [Bacteroidales bacterium]